MKRWLVLGFCFILFSSCFVSAAQSCDRDQLIMRLYDYSNSHVALWDESVDDYLVEICYDDIFGQRYEGDNPHDCTQSNANGVLALYDVTNAHAGRVDNGVYDHNVCYGDLSCGYEDGEDDFCVGGGEIIARMSDYGNAHVSSSFGVYPVKVCCGSVAAGVLVGGSVMITPSGTRILIPVDSIMIFPSDGGEMVIPVDSVITSSAIGPTITFPAGGPYGIPEGSIIEFPDGTQISIPDGEQISAATGEPIVTPEPTPEPILTPTVPHWADMNGGLITEVYFGATVRLVVPDADSGTFEIFEKDLGLDDEIKTIDDGQLVGSDWVGMWEIIDSDELVETDGDFDDFYFKLGGGPESGRLKIIVLDDSGDDLDGPGSPLWDNDGDGLSDDQERRGVPTGRIVGGEVETVETDPEDPDSDNDGFSDGHEVDDGTDPMDAGSYHPSTDTDSDGDGVTDAYENEVGSDINDPDSDDDGFSDGTEADAFTGLMNVGDHPQAGNVPINDPTGVEIVGFECGDYFDVDTTINIEVDVFDRDDAVFGNITINGDLLAEFDNDGMSSNPVDFDTPGTSQIVAEAFVDGESVRKVISNIMILGREEDGSYTPGDYVAACIDRPRDLENIRGSSVDFDASTTRGISVDDGGNLEVLIPGEHDFSWSWMFYPEMTEWVVEMGRNQLGYLFTVDFSFPGDNSASLVVEV